MCELHRYIKYISIKLSERKEGRKEAKESRERRGRKKERKESGLKLLMKAQTSAESAVT